MEHFSFYCFPSGYSSLELNRLRAILLDVESPLPESAGDSAPPSYRSRRARWPPAGPTCLRFWPAGGSDRVGRRGRRRPSPRSPLPQPSAATQPTGLAEKLQAKNPAKNFVVLYD